MGQFIPPPLLDSLEHTRRNLQPGGNIFNGKALFHAPFTQTGSQFFQCHDIPALENFIIDSCPADLLFLPGHQAYTCTVDAAGHLPQSRLITDYHQRPASQLTEVVRQTCLQAGLGQYFLNPGAGGVIRSG